MREVIPTPTLTLWIQNIESDFLQATAARRDACQPSDDDTYQAYVSTTRLSHHKRYQTPQLSETAILFTLQPETSTYRIQTDAERERDMRCTVRSGQVRKISAAKTKNQTEIVTTIASNFTTRSMSTHRHYPAGNKSDAWVEHLTDALTRVSVFLFPQ